MTISGERESEFREKFHEYTRTLDCVHCGLCIPDCPTHGITGREANSPRGRIYLMRGYAEGEIDLTPAVVKNLDECIVCRACETVCPSGIRMGDMMESFRAELDSKREKKSVLYRLGRFALQHILPYRSRIALISDLMWLYQKSGLRRIGDFVAKKLPGRIAALHAMQPEIPPPRERRIETTKHEGGGLYPAEGKARMRVGLFLGCIASEWFAPTHRATIRVLQKCGCDVVVPHEQSCCGALHRHAGELVDAESLYYRCRETFARSGVDVIVVNAAGCGAALKEPPASLPDGLGIPVRDICELLDEIGLDIPASDINMRVVYDQPCHLIHGQGIGADVVEGLLARIPGLKIVPLADSERCCGSGGVYNLVHPRLAMEIRDEKIASILEARPDIVVTGNPGCAMQIRSGLAGHDIEVLHPIDLLDRSFSPPETRA